MYTVISFSRANKKKVPDQPKHAQEWLFCDSIACKRVTECNISTKKVILDTVVLLGLILVMTQIWLASFDQMQWWLQLHFKG